MCVRIRAGRVLLSLASVVSLVAALAPQMTHVAAGRRAIVQNGPRNYAGKHCPGQTWNCTSNTQRLVQNGEQNVFECTRANCEVEQHGTDGGANAASCVQHATKQRTQRCSIQQTNGTGSNSIVVSQSASVSGRARRIRQSSVQELVATQLNQAGTNALVAMQSIAQSAAAGRKNHDRTHDQEAASTVRASQTSSSGDQSMDIDQVQDLRSQIVGERQTAQRQNTLENGSDIGANIVQRTSNGRSEVSVVQIERLLQSTEAPGAVQLQGSESGGVSFEADIDSDETLGGSSTVEVDQTTEWAQEASTASRQGQGGKLKIKIIPLTPDTVASHQRTTLRSGPASLQDCAQTAEIHARIVGTAEAQCTLDDGTGQPTVTAARASGTDFVLQNPAPPSGPLASVEGRVTNAQTGAPIAGAVIALVEAGASTSTLADGRYAIAGVTPGTYTLQASAPNFRNSSRSITLSAGERELQNFALVR